LFKPCAALWTSRFCNFLKKWLFPTKRFQKPLAYRLHIMSTMYMMLATSSQLYGLYCTCVIAIIVTYLSQPYYLYIIIYSISHKVKVYGLYDLAPLTVYYPAFPYMYIFKVTNKITYYINTYLNVQCYPYRGTYPF